ncbi:MAG: radical SAM protein, partial [Proteobacteria bacterium]|nr:radical SAM protein [Pseudomonadota bacterium]
NQHFLNEGEIMKVALLDILHLGDHRDYNGGFGTKFATGGGFTSRVMRLARSRNEFMPYTQYGYIAGILKRNGHEVQLVKNQVPKGFDVIILSGSLIRHEEEIQFLNKIDVETSSQVVIVGPLASKRPELFEGLYDTLIQGECESLLESTKDLTELPKGIVKSENWNAFETIGLPDYTIYDFKNFSMFPLLKNSPVIPICGSRSCPYKCDYCPYIVNKKSYRSRTAQAIVAEIEHSIKTYGSHSFAFRDPVFSMDRERVVELCGLIKEKGLKIEFLIETRTDRLDIELIDMMKEAGLRTIKIGVESADHEVLKKQKRVARFYILGLPEDTEESMDKTINYAVALNTTFANFTICTPIPGTSFFEQIKDQIVDTKLEHYDNQHLVFKHKNLENETVYRYMEKAFRKFYMRPKFVKRYIEKAMSF